MDSLLQVNNICERSQVIVLPLQIERKARHHHVHLLIPSSVMDSDHIHYFFYFHFLKIVWGWIFLMFYDNFLGDSGVDYSAKYPIDGAETLVRSSSADTIIQ